MKVEFFFFFNKGFSEEANYIPSRRTLAFSVTDGVQVVSCLELAIIPFFPQPFPLGAKILISRAAIRFLLSY
jgi:hypothetical protein